MSWFTAEADDLLTRYEVARVAADPALLPAAAEPGGCRSVIYYRLHGSPRVYYSPYHDDYLAQLAAKLQSHGQAGAKAWCIFDNTALGAAMPNARSVVAALKL